MEQRKVIAELKAEVDNKFQQAKADVEAMILGTKNISVANREQGTARRHPNDLDKST